MARVTVPFIGSRHLDRSLQVNAQRTVNWIPQLEGDGAKSVLTLQPTPGLNAAGTAGNGPCRSGFYEFLGALYWVSGQQLMKRTSGGTVSAVGTLNTSSGACYMAVGRIYIAVVDGGDLYTWNDTTFAVNADPQLPAAPSYITYLDGWFIVINGGTDEFHISANEDPTNWASDFGVAESSGDNAVACVATTSDLYIIGTKTTEVYYNSGNPDFPFQIYANGTLEVGTPAAASVARNGTNLFMVAQTAESSPTIVRINGFQVQRIADQDVAYTLSQMTTYSDAHGFAYTQADATYYVVTFPTEGVTLVYHVEQDMWHERQSDGLEIWRVYGAGSYAGRTYVGDYSTNDFYYLDLMKYTDNGATIRRERVMEALHRDRRLFEVNTFEVEMKAGVGLVSGQGSDPQVMLQYSKDGGNTWSAERWRSIGKIGEFGQRAVWNRFGTMTDFRARLVVTDPIEAAVISAYADVEVLSA
jgi:hypothetical protein